jgi:hypothetical protein
MVEIIFSFAYSIYIMFLQGGIFLYIAPDDNRDGLSELISVLNSANIKCKEATPCPDE